MEYINALGRRKSAVARIYMKEGSGKITINKRDLGWRIHRTVTGAPTRYRTRARENQRRRQESTPCCRFHHPRRSRGGAQKAGTSKGTPQIPVQQTLIYTHYILYILRFLLTKINNNYSFSI